MSTELIRQYTTTLKRLINFYHTKSTNKSLSGRHQNRCNILISESPIQAIEFTGPKIYIYKDIINDGDLSLLAQYSNDVPEDESDLIECSCIVADIWENITETEKVLVTQYVQKLLHTYVSYLLLDTT
jgi:hypothetical protein